MLGTHIKNFSGHNCRVTMIPEKPGQLEKVRKFENWPENPLNLKIDKNIREKSGNFPPMLEVKCKVIQA